MKRLKDFFIVKLKEIIIVAVILGLFRSVFFLGSLDIQYFYMVMDIVIFLMLIYLITAFLFFRKQESVKSDNKRLRMENQVLRQEIISQEKGLWEYFILWIHQIKTPLAAAAMILENDDIKDKEKRLKTQLIYIEQYVRMPMSYLKIIKTNADMDIADVKIDTVIRGLLKRYSHIFIVNHITLFYEPVMESVITDAKWLEILIEQLLSNALKYTENGRIEISFDRERTALNITDTGIGIRSEDLPKIFDRGYSGFNGRLNEKSSGLGLYLAKEVAKRLHIKIEVSSEFSKGSTFTLIFQK